jgi:hypothetical protein
VSTVVPERRPSPARIAAFAALLSLVAWALGALAAWPWAATPSDAAVLRVSLRHVTGFTAAARARSAEELARLPAHMRPRDPDRPTTGRRADAALTIVVDGRTRLDVVYRPTGLRHDGPIYGYHEVPLTPGRHRIEVTLAEAGTREPDRAWRLSREIEVAPGRAPLAEYTTTAGWRLE